MKRDIAFSGILGLVLGLFIFFLASTLKTYIPTLISDLVTSIVVFAILFLFALAEMPVMVFGMRYIASSSTISRRIIDSIFLFYVSFASVYASIFALMTSADYSNLGIVLAALGFVRFVSGIFIK